MDSLGLPLFISADCSRAEQSRMLGLFAAYCYEYKGNAASTIANKIAAVRWYHVHHGGVELPHHPIEASIIKALQKLSGGTKPRHGMYLSAILSAYEGICSQGAKAAFIWHGVLAAYFLLARTSELFRSASGDKGLKYCVVREDVTFYSAGAATPISSAHTADEVRVVIRRSKTDQPGDGSTRSLRANGGGLNDPVACFAWLLRHSHSGSPTQPLMTIGSARGPHVITRYEVATLVKDIAARAGLVPALYSTHSMRIGAATTLAHAGLEPRLIMLAGRWRSTAFMVYVRDNLEDFRRISDSLASTRLVDVMPQVSSKRASRQARRTR